MTSEFTWRDAGRIVVFRRGVLADAPELLREQGFDEFTLLSTERALAGAEALAEAAGAVHLVGPGQVPALAAAALGEVGSAPVVALGGGRVIDTAKATASATGAPAAAIPTTLSGAEMTAIHRLPARAEEQVEQMVRPSLVLADPEPMTGQHEPQLRASAMNALAHGADTLYLPLSNPVSEMTTLRGAELIAATLDQERDRRDRAALALASLLCGYAIDSAGIGLHHLVCQTLVRVCGTPHAETNAAVLPHALALLAERAPKPYERLAEALGADRDGLPQRVEELGRPDRLGQLGGDASKIEAAIAAMLKRSELMHVPRPPSREELTQLVRKAW